MTSELSVDVLETADEVAKRAALAIAALAREAIEVRGRFLMPRRLGRARWEHKLARARLAHSCRTSVRSTQVSTSARRNR
jgi:hypothetical protein